MEKDATYCDGVDGRTQSFEGILAKKESTLCE
jgi:hypothetical protein